MSFIATDASTIIDKSALAIRNNIAQVESALSEFDKISAGMADLAARYPVDLVYDVTTGKGMAEAVTHRAAWRDPRINVEKFRKTAKAPVLALGKDIDARAAWLTEQLQAGEEPVHEQIKAEEDRRAKIKADHEAAEFGRVLAITEAIAEIGLDVQIVSAKPSSTIAAALDALRTTALEKMVYQEMMPQAVAARDAAIAKLELAFKARRFDEQQQEAIAEAERQRVADQAAADAERARAAEANRIEAARLAEVAAQQDAQAKRIADSLSALEKAQQDADDRKAADAAAEAARAEAARIAALPTTKPVAPAVEPAVVPAEPELQLQPGAAAWLGSLSEEDLSSESPADIRPPITTGALCERLGFTVNAAFISGLGFTPADRPEGAKVGTFWRASDWPFIRAAIARHVLELPE